VNTILVALWSSFLLLAVFGLTLLAWFRGREDLEAYEAIFQNLTSSEVQVMLDRAVYNLTKQFAHEEKARRLVDNRIYVDDLPVSEHIENNHLPRIERMTALMKKQC
jgi:hypothetical protein